MTVLAQLWLLNLVDQLDFKHTCAPAQPLLPSVRTDTFRLKKGQMLDTLPICKI